jgi:hypothetical protein
MLFGKTDAFRPDRAPCECRGTSNLLPCSPYLIGKGGCWWRSSWRPRRYATREVTGWTMNLT